MSESKKKTLGIFESEQALTTSKNKQVPNQTIIELQAALREALDLNGLLVNQISSKSQLIQELTNQGELKNEAIENQENGIIELSKYIEINAPSSEEERDYSEISEGNDNLDEISLEQKLLMEQEELENNFDIQSQDLQSLR